MGYQIGCARYRGSGGTRPRHPGTFGRPPACTRVSINRSGAVPPTLGVVALNVLTLDMGAEAVDLAFIAIPLAKIRGWRPTGPR